MKKKINIFLSMSLMFIIVFLGVILLAIFQNWTFSLIFLGVYAASILFTIVIIRNKSRRFETRLRWSIFIIAVPFVGMASYILFGRSYKYKTDNEYRYKNFSEFATSHDRETSRHALETLAKESPQYKRAFVLGNNLQNDTIYDQTNTKLLDNGADFVVSLFRDIKKAEKYILLNFYVIKDGELLDNLVALLKSKAAQGVNIYIIYDFTGCYTDFKYETQTKLQEAGIRLVPFAPLNLPWINWTANYRDHRKDVSIDGKIGYIGGINLSDEYINMSSKFGFWNDAHVRIAGAAVQGIEKIFASDWNFCHRQQERITDLEPSVGTLHSIENYSNDLTQIVSSGPNHNTPMHFDLMMSLVNSAQKRIWISSPYFVPPVELINALCTAAKSGIDVKLVIPGKTDKKLLLEVSKRWTRQLFEAGVRIYSMNNTFNHTKAYLFDDNIAFIGSTNLDFRAFFSDQQTMALIKSETFNKELETRFLWDFSKSFEYTFLPNDELPTGKKVLVAMFNIISPLL
ncbi:cardiolipin synthase [Mesoplasma syrphidae]|uniref:Cardiolipin synthase n=1 Tax=Mesoplasma syrphidae TaxID=225999 RepID=A0A2K9C1D4_9MOLU|nr:cardiolipin synthase [Mesoplasma syrphidae]AUF83289.1 cardiolipin synthase [Mesoplasma syrphidae]